ncbi:MAG: hypothetical protein EYR95_04425 [Phormidium sp. SL48-SHIP]|nr:MAG: hypothetical protein EYR95_04425 [Phormidium sp. SL48-SHIP]
MKKSFRAESLALREFQSKAAKNFQKTLKKGLTAPDSLVRLVKRSGGRANNAPQTTHSEPRKLNRLKARQRSLKLQFFV